jgi:CIC family chloride channel protein
MRQFGRMKLRWPLRLGLVRLSLLAIVVGVVTGLGAVIFGIFSLDYEANVFTPPSPWGGLIILVPVVGGQIVTFLITNFAPEARGCGHVAI